MSGRRATAPQQTVGARPRAAAPAACGSAGAMGACCFKPSVNEDAAEAQSASAAAGDRGRGRAGRAAGRGAPDGARPPPPATPHPSLRSMLRPCLPGAPRPRKAADSVRRARVCERAAPGPGNKLLCRKAPVWSSETPMTMGSSSRGAMSSATRSLPCTQGRKYGRRSWQALKAAAECQDAHTAQAIISAISVTYAPRCPHARPLATAPTIAPRRARCVTCVHTWCVCVGRRVLP